MLAAAVDYETLPAWLHTERTNRNKIPETDAHNAARTSERLCASANGGTIPATTRGVDDFGERPNKPFDRAIRKHLLGTEADRKVYDTGCAHQK